MAVAEVAVGDVAHPHQEGIDEMQSPRAGVIENLTGIPPDDGAAHPQSSGGGRLALQRARGGDLLLLHAVASARTRPARPGVITTAEDIGAPAVAAMGVMPRRRHLVGIVTGTANATASVVRHPQSVGHRLVWRGSG